MKNHHGKPTKNSGLKSVMRAVASMVVALAAVSLTHCASQSKSSATSATDKAESKTWAKGMRGMAESLQRLMPYVFSRDEFNDPNNRAAIHDRIANFAAGVAEVPKHAGEAMLGKDPLVQFSIARLTSNAHHAQQAFDEGHLEFSRTVLRESMGLCFSCHSSQQFGPQDNFSTSSLSPNFRIYPTERADYYVATRQFDKAVDLLEGVLKSPAQLLDDPHEQVDSLRKYLSLEVRVKNDPNRAAGLLEKFLSQKDLPYFIAADAEVWLKSLRDWQREKPSTTSALVRAQALTRKARNLQATGGYQSGYVDFLRVTSILHEGLRSAASLKDKSHYYEMLGQSYDTLSEMGTWDLPEVYFEACIRASPKSEESKRCYREFERAIVLGFSGSAGVFIPKEERERMNDLKALAGFSVSNDFAPAEKSPEKH